VYAYENMYAWVVRSRRDEEKEMLSSGGSLYTRLLHGYPAILTSWER
jgi:hypothetical protein